MVKDGAAPQVAEMDAKLEATNEKIDTLTKSMTELVKEVQKLKFPTTTSPPISHENVEDLAEVQNRRMNLIMSFIPINVDTNDRGVGEVEKFFEEKFGVTGGERGLVESVEPIGAYDRHMVKIKFKCAWKRSQLLRMAPTKLQEAAGEAPAGRKPSLKPDFSFRERAERKRLGDEVRNRPGGWAQWTIRNGTIVER